MTESPIRTDLIVDGDPKIFQDTVALALLGSDADEPSNQLARAQLPRGTDAAASSSWLIARSRIRHRLCVIRAVNRYGHRGEQQEQWQWRSNG